MRCRDNNAPSGGLLFFVSEGRLHSRLENPYSHGWLRPEHSHTSIDLNHCSNLPNVMQQLFESFGPLHNSHIETWHVQQCCHRLKNLSCVAFFLFRGCHGLVMLKCDQHDDKERLLNTNSLNRSMKRSMDQTLVFVTFAANCFPRRHPLPQYALKCWMCTFKGLETDIQWNLWSF